MYTKLLKNYIKRRNQKVCFQPVIPMAAPNVHAIIKQNKDEQSFQYKGPKREKVLY